ncbi:hypothetical protein [Halovenus salina]|uniref:Halobacterial output domain-containing protein n=1 Tax=Halovenus salina TaxID=1510225 RepID=A0ABD5VVZ7_9EURY|nr:hypothetical protein [Halovenus salina]
MSDAEIETQGGVTVTLDADDLNHLLTHGRAVVCKDAGPLEIKIKADGKVRHQVVLDDGHGESEVIAGGEQQ